MQVILLQDVRGIGQKHDLKEVADGYALNFLLPRKLAELATPDKVEKLEAARAAADREHAAQEAALAQAIEALSGREVHLAVRATEKGGLFRSIGAHDIAAAARQEHGFSIPEEAILLQAPIKTTGTHSAELKAGQKKHHLSIIVAAS